MSYTSLLKKVFDAREAHVDGNKSSEAKLLQQIEFTAVEMREELESKGFIYVANLENLMKFDMPVYIYSLVSGKYVVSQRPLSLTELKAFKI